MDVSIPLLQRGGYEAFRKVLLPCILFCSKKSCYYESSLTPGLFKFQIMPPRRSNGCSNSVGTSILIGNIWMKFALLGLP